MLRPQIEAGGAGKIIVQVATEFNRRGIDVIIASAGGEWWDQLNDVATCYHVPLFPSTPQNFIRSLIQIRRIVKIHQIDILNSHHRFTTMVCNFAFAGQKKPVISTVHEIKGDRTKLSRYSYGSTAMVFSEAVRKNLVEIHGMDPDAVHVIPYGMAFPEPTALRIENVRQELRLQDGIPVVSYIGRLSKEKGCDVFIRAAALVRSQGIKAKYLVVGDGPQSNELCMLARSLEVEESIIFTGWQDDVASIIMNSEFLVQPSYTEGLGITIIEAMALGKPTIGTSAGSIPELIQHGTNGLVVPVGDVNMIADAIVTLLNEPGYVDTLGQCAKKFYNSNLTSNQMIEKMVEVLSINIK
jgi:glycosyltransferase involved in cell wall biosynthesis